MNKTAKTDYENTDTDLQVELHRRVIDRINNIVSFTGAQYPNTIARLHIARPIMDTLDDIEYETIRLISREAHNYGYQP